MNRNFDVYWPFLGLIFAIPFYFGKFKLPSINLEVISILLGGLLALLLIIPTIENFRQIKKLKESGHIEDLVYYIRFPLTLSILFILIEFFSSSFTLLLDEKLVLILKSIYFGLWSVFFLALIRLLSIIPHMLYNKS
jgi:hypothetical protein